MLTDDVKIYTIGDTLVLRFPFTISKDSQFPFKSDDIVRIKVDPDNQIVTIERVNPDKRD